MAKLLIVDDDTLTVEMMSDMLAMHGHDVKTADCGLECLDIAGKCRPEIVILDISLPDMEAGEIIQAIRSNKELEGLKILGVSGLSRPVAEEKAPGMDGYLEKPVDFKKLFEIVKQMES